MLTTLLMTGKISAIKSEKRKQPLVQQISLPLISHELQIRRSLRAKRLRVSINLVGEIEVVAPRRASTKEVQHFIQAQYSWISLKKQQIESLRSVELNNIMPSRIELPAIGEQWKISYLQVSSNAGITANEATPVKDVTLHNVLRLYFEHEGQVRQLLKQWLTQKAVATLLPWLRKTSDETGLNYAAGRVRGQKTRWASCSSRKTINLNRCMLFLKPEQVRYLMVHELCHTKQMNHSAKFWQLVSKYVPDYQCQEKLVNESCFRLPRWVF